MTPQPDQRGRLRPTRLSTLALVFLAGAVLGWFGMPLLRQASGSVPTIPWVSVVALAFAGAALLGMAWQTWNRLHRRRQRIDPHRAVNFLVLAKASALVGAVVAGVYLGYVAQYVGGLGYEGPTSRVVRGGAATLAGLAIVVGGVLLERACIVPRRDDEDEDAEEGNDKGRR